RRPRQRREARAGDGLPPPCRPARRGGAVARRARGLVGPAPPADQAAGRGRARTPASCGLTPAAWEDPGVRIEVTTIADLLGAAADEHDGDALVFPDGRLTFR